MAQYKLMKLTPKRRKYAIVEIIQNSNLVRVKEVVNKSQAKKKLKEYRNKTK